MNAAEERGKVARRALRLAQWSDTIVRAELDFDEIRRAVDADPQGVSATQLVGKGVWALLPDFVRSGAYLIEGSVFMTRHTFFAVMGDVEKCGHPTWDYIVDPYPLDVMPAAGHAALILSPESPLQQLYRWRPPAKEKP